MTLHDLWPRISHHPITVGSKMSTRHPADLPLQEAWSEEVLIQSFPKEDSSTQIFEVTSLSYPAFLFLGRQQCLFDVRSTLARMRMKASRGGGDEKTGNRIIFEKREGGEDTQWGTGKTVEKRINKDGDSPAFSVRLGITTIITYVHDENLK